MTYIISYLCDTGLLVRGVSTTGWRSLSYAYRLFADQFPGLDLQGISEPEAVTQVLRFYLRAMGPATEGDVKWWTGLNQADIRPALKGLAGELTEVYVSDGPEDAGAQDLQ